MAVTVTVYPQQITWNSETWSKSGTGGPLSVRVMHSGRAVEDRTGDAEYPMYVAIVDKGVRVAVSLRDVKRVTALGTSGSMVITLLTKGGGSTSTVTVAACVLEGVAMSQDRATPGGQELTFVVESTDGSTIPIT
jgi:hypothetical protein